MNNIFLIIGESGAGKDTIVNTLCERHNYKKLISYTTRPIREDDPNDKFAHIFLTKEQFDKLTDLVAYTRFNNYEYCATTQQVESSDIYIIDYQGIEYFKKHYKGSKNPCVIYISTPKEDRFLRMRHRQGNTPKATEMAMDRIKHDSTVFSNAVNVADYIIDNSLTGETGIEFAVEQLQKIINERGVNTMAKLDDLVKTLNTYEKIIYLSHPYGGELENKQRIENLAKQYVEKYPNYLFVSPIHCFGYLYDTLSYDEGLRLTLWLLQQCTEMWVCSNNWETSKGVKAEIEYCKLNHIPYCIKNDLVLYTIDCPKCKVLKMKLDAKHIPYQICTDEQVMFTKGIDMLPVLELSDGRILSYTESVKYVNEYKE